MIRNLLIGLGIVAASSLVGCFGSTPPKLEAGRCQLSEDCPNGQTCRKTVCEDIYYPEHQIKNY